MKTRLKGEHARQQYDHLPKSDQSTKAKISKMKPTFRFLALLIIHCYA